MNAETISDDDFSPPLAGQAGGCDDSAATEEVLPPTLLARAIRRALDLKYAKASDNEAKFGTILTELSLVARTAFGGGGRQVRAALLADPNDPDGFMPNNSFVRQPFGTQSAPDFVVKAGGKAFFVEMKSSKGTSPVFNSGLPEHNIIYLFTSGRHNKTMCFLGQDVLPQELYNLMVRAREDCTALVEKNYNQQMLGDSRNLLNLRFYVRPMHEAKIDVFRELDIRKLEENVFDFIRKRHGQ